MSRKRSRKVKWMKHYNNKQKILLVGEGDFSFSACLAAAFGSAANMIATSLYSKRTLRTMHRTCEANLELLKSKGCLVLHGVNVYDMSGHPTLTQMKFDIIIFNFPHAGFFPGLNEYNYQVIKWHKELVNAFFKSAREMLNEDGEVHVTNRDDHPYNKWNLKELGEKSGLILKEKVDFLKEEYPGYQNKRGSGSKSNKTFPLKHCYTFKFSIDKNSTQMLKTLGDDEIDSIVVALKILLSGWLKTLAHYYYLVTYFLCSSFKQ